jgi:hypothetical protein
MSSKKRRHASSAILSIIKSKGDLKTDDGKIYKFKNGRIIELGPDGNKYVIRATKKGVIHRLEFEKDEDLVDERYDITLKDNPSGLKDLARKVLIQGDEDLTKKVSRHHVLNIEDVPPEKLYWNQMTEEEKYSLLEKLNSDEDE